MSGVPMGRQFEITIEHATKFQRSFLSQARYHYFDWIKFHESFMGIHFLDVCRETVVPMALHFSMAFSSTKLPPLSGLALFLKSPRNLLARLPMIIECWVLSVGYFLQDGSLSIVNGNCRAYGTPLPRNLIATKLPPLWGSTDFYFAKLTYFQKNK